MQIGLRVCNSMRYVPTSGLAYTCGPWPTRSTSGSTWPRKMVKMACFAAAITLPIGAEAQALVPFKVTTEGGICNTASSPSANPEILIDGNRLFVVTSILIRTGPQNPSGYEFLSINSLRINGLLFDTRTGNLTGPVSGTGVNESADLMGTPIRRTSDPDTDLPGGNFPHQIVAAGSGENDIEIQLFCRADDQDLEIDMVLVAGWKRPRDVITVVYEPGN